MLSLELKFQSELICQSVLNPKQEKKFLSSFGNQSEIMGNELAGLEEPQNLRNESTNKIDKYCITLYLF